MLHQRFISRLLNRPQLITPAAGAAVVHALMPGVRLDGFSGAATPVPRDPREYGVVGRTAVIPIIGELVHRGSGMDAMSGVCSYQDLQDMCSDALGDPGVTGILLDIDSPGGEAGGNMDFAEWLAGQRGTKPIFASINSQACSGAYSIASAADPGGIHIGQDAEAGSIGVVTYHTDLSRMLANDGVVVTWVYAGDRKIDRNPTQPLSPEAEAATQLAVDTIYARFCSLVAANRGMSVQAVRDTQAGIFMGQAAVAAGLADRIATQEEALMAVATRSAPAGARLSVNRPTGAPTMATDPAVPATVPATAPAPVAPATPVPTPLAAPGAAPADAPVGPVPNAPHSPTHGPADAAEVANMCTAAGHPEMIAGLINARASVEGVRARCAAATEIKQIAASVGLPSMAAHLVKNGLSVADARVELFNMKASRDAGTRTDTTPPADRNQGAAPSGAAIDATAIHARMNTRHQRGRAA